MARLARVILAALCAARGKARLFERGHARTRAIFTERGHQGAIIGLRVFLGRAANAVALNDVGPAHGFVRRTPEAGDIATAIGGLEFAIAAFRRAFREIADVHLHRAIMDFERERTGGEGAFEPAQTLNAAQGTQNERGAFDRDFAGLAARRNLFSAKHEL